MIPLTTIHDATTAQPTTGSGGLLRAHRVSSRQPPATGAANRGLTSPADQPVPPRTPLPSITHPTGTQLTRILASLVSWHDLWERLLVTDPTQRWFTRLAGGEGWEAWLHTWPPRSGIDPHDHGVSHSALTVLRGTLQESRPTTSGRAQARDTPSRSARSRSTRSRAAAVPAVDRQVLAPGDVRVVTAHQVHAVHNPGPTHAVSLHVYGPVLTQPAQRLPRTRSHARSTSLTRPLPLWSTP